MLAFITSIRHPHNSNSYERVWELLERTLHSVTRQTNDDYVVIVVANMMGTNDAAITWRSDKVHFVLVDFEPPSTINAAGTDMDAIRIDRGTKYAIGLAEAERLRADRIMFFDADDFVSKEIAGHVATNPDVDGWLLNDGWLLKHDRIMAMSKFYLRCGTCSILPFDVLRTELPRSLTVQSSQDYIVSALETNFLLYILGSHKFAPNTLEAMGRPLTPLPFPGAVRFLATGENHSDFVDSPPSERDWRLPFDQWSPLTDEFVDEFGITT